MAAAKVREFELKMVPTAIRRQLARLRRRERLLDFVWGTARWLSLTAALLLGACFIDWLVDREQDTPIMLRRALAYLQIAVATAAGFWFLVWPLRKRLTPTTLALRVEDKYPRLSHRLISAVELNQPAARTGGMSPELIRVVTDEAVAEASTLDFREVADHRRLRRTAALLAPVALACAVPLMLWPQTVHVLLERQFGSDREIPRDVAIEPITAPVWPSGEKVVLRFKVRGPGLSERTGSVWIQPDGQAGDRYPLELQTGGHPSDEEAVAVAGLPPASTDFSFTARFGDGRMKSPGRVRYEPRPVIVEQIAWIQYPAFCGLREDGSHYDQLQSGGDVVGIAGSSARVTVKTQKPIARGIVELLRPEKPKQPAEEETPEVVSRTVPLHILKDGSCQTRFDLRSEETGYRLVVVDRNGFVNIPQPRRHVRLVPEEPPQVALLKEQFPPALVDVAAGGTEDFVVDGLPLPQGGSIPIAFTASGPYGLGQARLLFRVLKKTASGNDEPADEPWLTLPLGETTASERAGPFDPRVGAFQGSGPRDQIYFHAVAATPPLPRMLGGGRFDFKTTGIPDGKAGLRTLQIGDQVEYCIEVTADKDGKPGRPTARSESRVKTVVSFGDLERWLADNLQEARRLRELENKQRGLFER
jgi:hypothetical protein